MVARARHRGGTHDRISAVALAAFLSILCSPARAQYIYLDTNGDGYNTTADTLNPTGTTTLRILLRTNAMRNGSQGLCSSDDGELTLRSYEFILHAAGGTVTWGEYTNLIADFPTGKGVQSDARDYATGFSGPAELPPGSHLLGALVVSVASGSPSIAFAAQTPLSTSYHTAFGSACSGLDYDNLLKLGLDWTNADGTWPGTPSWAGVLILAQPSNMTLSEGETADQGLTATLDVYGEGVTFSLASGPAFATVTTTGFPAPGNATGSIHLAPGFSDAGVYLTAVTASTNFRSDTKTFIITVDQGDRAPVLKQPMDMMPYEGYSMSQTLSASDADNDPISFLKVDGPPYMTVSTYDPFYGVGFVLLEPAIGDVGMTMATVGATDGILTDTRMFSIMVRDTNFPPELIVPLAQTVAEGDALRFDVTAADPDGDMVTLTASGLPAGASFLDGGYGTGAFLWVPGFDQTGSHTVTFMATDMPGMSVAKDVAIQVSDVARAVALAQPLDMTLLEATVKDQALHAIDQSGDPLQFSKAGGPAYMTVTTVVAGTGAAEGAIHLAPGLSDAGASTGTVAVTDGVDRDERTFRIDVQDAGPGPGEGGPPFFPPPISIATGLTPHTVTSGDVNRDGHSDLVTTGLGENTVSVRLGNGDGTFGPRANYPTGTKPHTVALADMNADGILDMAISNNGETSIGVMLGAADGTFGAMARFPIHGSPMFLGVVDLDSDGRIDVVATDMTNGTLAVLMGHGDGTLSQPVDYPTGARCHGLAIGDLNNDRKPDVVAANPGPSTVSVLLGRGDGTLESKGDIVTSSPHTVAIGDLDRDGLPDLVVANFDSGTISLLLGLGDGTFRALPDLVTGAGAHAALIRDLDRDGVPDLIVANQTAGTQSFFMGTGGGTFGPKTDFADGAGAHCIATGDWNEDKGVDVVVSNIFSNTLTIFLNGFPPEVDLPARAFLVDRSKALPLAGPDKEFPCIQVEPVDGAYANRGVLLESITLTFEGSGSAKAIHAIAGKAVVVADRDKNGVEEITACFAKEDIRAALAGLTRGPHSVPATVRGSLVTGGRFQAALELRVIVPGAPLHASVAPNPLNPEATLSVTTSREGYLRAWVFDLEGRLVRILADQPLAAAGRHEWRIDGGIGSGGRLASGVYFYRVEAFEGVSAGRFVVLK